MFNMLLSWIATNHYDLINVQYVSFLNNNESLWIYRCSISFLNNHESHYWDNQSTALRYHHDNGSERERNDIITTGQNNGRPLSWWWWSRSLQLSVDRHCDWQVICSRPSHERNGTVPRSADVHRSTAQFDSTVPTRRVLRCKLIAFVPSRSRSI